MGGVKLLLVVQTLIHCIFALGRTSLRYNIREELPPRTFIGNVPVDANLIKMYGADTMTKLQFSFLSQGSELKNAFVIEEKTGIIRTLERIDRDTVCALKDECVLELDVAVKPVQYFHVIKVILTINDINDNGPEFSPNEVTYKISEAAAPGTTFRISPASDPDSKHFAVRRYELTGDSEHFNLRFSESPDGEQEIVLVLMKQLDREVTDQHQLQILAFDGGNPPKQNRLQVNVIVLDANDNKPQFKNKTYETTLRENAPLRTRVAQVQATDLDTGENGNITYSLSKSTLENYGSIFAVNPRTGIVYTVGNIDYEQGILYQLTVIARDHGPDSVPTQVSVVIRIIDANDNAPQISINTLTVNGAAEISENAKVGTFIAHLSVIDVDSELNGKVFCYLNDTKFHLQKLYPTAYKIVTAAVFDHEQKDKYLLSLTCRDSGIPTKITTKKIPVTVKDLNDNAPVFGKNIYQLPLSENAAVGTKLLRVEATDADRGSHGFVTYRLHTDAGKRFTIDPRTGFIHTRTMFDYETTQEVRFRVIASDNGTPVKTSTATVIVSITDIDDEMPEFSQTTYSFGTFENQPVGTNIGKVTVTDRDTSPNNKYKITWGTNSKQAQKYLQLDFDTGVISVKRNLDREEINTIKFGLIAKSTSGPSYHSSASVTVYVADQNDNAPVILFPSHDNHTVYLSSRVAVGHVLSRVRATDADIGQNGALSFNITGGNIDNVINIDPNNGALTLASPVENEGNRKVLNLKIAVRDHGKPPRETETQLTVVFTLVTVLSTGLHGAPSGEQIYKQQPLFDQLTLIIVGTLGSLALLLCVCVTVAIVIIRRGRNKLPRKADPSREMQFMLNQNVASEERSQVNHECPSVRACALWNRHHSLVDDNLSSAGSTGSQIMDMLPSSDMSNSPSLCPESVHSGSDGCCDSDVSHTHVRQSDSELGTFGVNRPNGELRKILLARRSNSSHQQPRQALSASRSTISSTASSSSSCAGAVRLPIKNNQATSHPELYGKVVIHRNPLNESELVNSKTFSEKTEEKKVRVGVKFVEPSSFRIPYVSDTKTPVNNDLNPLECSTLQSVSESVSDSGISDGSTEAMAGKKSAENYISQDTGLSMVSLTTQQTLTSCKDSNV